MKKFQNYSIYPYFLLMRLDRPIGIFLLLWPTLWGLWIAAQGVPDPLILTVFILGVIIMRSAGCVINDLADQKFDAHVERTKQRPLVTGLLTSHQALVLFVRLCLLAFMLVLLLNRLTLILSLMAVFLAATYPFMKRITPFPQVYLGIAFGFSVPMGFAAVTNDIPDIAWIIFLTNVLWTVAYDTMYAMVDREDDLKIGIKSTAILFGRFDRLIIALLQLSVIILFIYIGQYIQATISYYLAIIPAALLAIYQQYLIKDRDKVLCLKAFLNNNWFGFSLFLALLLNYFPE